jgi:tetratricopeptide (TPR) repeat protein
VILDLFISRRFGLAKALAILSIVVCSTALGQNHPPPQASVIRVEGRVRGIGGDAIDGAVVVIEEAKGRPSVAETKTDSAGNFVLSVDHAGTYIVHVEKPRFRAAESQPLALAAGEKKHVDLILRSAGAADSASAGSSQGTGDSAAAPPKSSSPAAGAMDFADTPNFTVAGVTDYSNVGLHGSDARVRTSEALNKETLAMKSANASGGAPGGSESSSKNETGAEEERKLRAALVQSPNSFDANHQLGEFCLRSERYKQAIPPLEAAYRIDPGNRDNAYDLALAYEGSGDLARAREQALKIPTNADTHRLLGDLDEELGDPVAAVHEYEQAAQSDPSEQNYFDWGAELLLHKAALPAVEVLSKGSSAYPKSARILAGLGAALYASGSYDEAARRLCDASDLDPAYPAPYLLLGEMEMAAPAPLPCSQERLAQFAREQPGNAFANYYYAMDLWKRDRASEKPGDLQQPQALLEKAVALDPKFGEAYVQLGVLYSEQKQEQQAIASFRKAIAVSPELGDAHYRLSLAYKRIGEDAKAREEMQTYEQIEKTENAAMERKRRELRQFLIILKDKPTTSP